MPGTCASLSPSLPLMSTHWSHTCCTQDEEALALWRDVVGVPPDRIKRMGAADNFWSSGPTGPCGPCSELYFDFHPERGTGEEVGAHPGLTQPPRLPFLACVFKVKQGQTASRTFHTWPVVLCTS